MKNAPFVAVVLIALAAVLFLRGGDMLAGEFTMPFQNAAQPVSGGTVTVIAAGVILLFAILIFLVYFVSKWFV